MRIPIVIALLIATVAAAVGWNNHLQLAKVREDHARMTSTAASQGVSLDPKHGIRVTKHVRENPVVEIEQVIADYFALEQEMQAKGATYAQDEIMLKRYLEITEELNKRLVLLDAAQLKRFFLNVEGNQGIGELTRRGFFDHVRWVLSEKHPRGFLAFLADSPEFFGNTPDNESRVEASLRRLAKNDLAVTIDWIQTHGKRFPHLVTENAKGAVIFTAAGGDPKLAFQLIGDLDFENPDHAVSNIAVAARNSKKRTDTLAALREYLASLKDAEARERSGGQAINHLTRSATAEGFQTGSKWLAEAGFSSEELGYVAYGVRDWVKSDEIGQWIVWLGEKIPDGNGKESIRSTISKWTQEDHQAAGTWLASAPDGPGKISAVRAFAETVSKYDPEVAAQWAMTLPPGEDRDAALRNIHGHRPEKEPAAQEAYGVDYDIK